MKEKEATSAAMDLKTVFRPQNLKLALFAVLGIALILVGSLVSSSSNRAKPDSQASTDLTDHARALEAALEEAISSIRGVGKVRAMVTLSSGPENVYAQNTTRSSTSQTETLESGAQRESTSDNETSQPVSGRFGGSETPLLEKVIPVKVAGCLIVAEGASSSRVKADIYRAVEALLGIPMYKIEVAPMKGGK